MFFYHYATSFHLSADIYIYSYKYIVAVHLFIKSIVSILVVTYINCIQTECFNCVSSGYFQMSVW